MYKLGSLFDGSGGFPLAGTLCGIEPVWAAEVEPYPIAVTRSRFPNMKHLGDISKVNGADIEPVDIITFGSPCQDLSVAGKRAGLKHEANGDEETTRSGLFMEAVRIIKEMRKATNGQYPRFALWENVPGAFSSNKGEDFRIVCEELIKIVEPSASMPSVPQNGWNYADSYVGDGWSLAYRVFDAQYWGVPQRRRRIHLVADFRGECAREILFEREGLRGYFAEGRTPWQTTPADAQGSTGADDRGGEANGDGRGRQLDDVAYTMKIRSGCDVDSSGKAAGKGALIQKDKSATLSTVQDQYLFQPIADTHIIDNIGGQAEYGKPSVVNGTLRAGAQGAVAYSFDSLASNSMKSKNPHSGCREVEVSKTLDTSDPNPSKNQGGIAVVEPVYSVENHPADSRVNLDESGKVQTLTSRMGTGGGNVPMVMEPFCKSARGKFKGDAETWVPAKVSNTLNTFDTGEARANELVVSSDANFIDVEMEVAVRKYEVNCELLCECLRDHKAASNFSNRDIAEALNRPVTLVEHWFRQDNSFAVPDPDVWYDLKKLLGIETTEFDQSVTEFEFKGGNYDMRNRIHVGDTAPTLTCGSGNNLHLLPNELVCMATQQGGAEIRTDGKAPTITAAAGMSGNNQPVICLQGNGIDRADTAGCNGKGWNDESCYTLNTIDRPAVVYAVDQGGGKSGANVSEGTAPTLCTTHGGEPAVAYGLDRASFNQGQNAKFDFSVTEEQQPCLTARGPGAVVHASKASFFTRAGEGAADTLVATDYKDPQIVAYEHHPRYIVRRLTPTECARLQGFAEWWGRIEPKKTLTDEEHQFWMDVRNTHAAINGKRVQEYTKRQMLIWYNKLYTDSAEYKMWGNGIALPTALYVVQGMAEVLNRTIEEEDWML